MGRTEIAVFQPHTYKTLQSGARKTTISKHEINDMGCVQGELPKGVTLRLRRYRKSHVLDVLRKPVLTQI